jgi:hypothetical protein
VTALINHVKTKEFLETAFHRMAAAHQVPLIMNPLDNLDKVEKKPWVYTSGGTMNTLVSCYYRLEDKPKEASKWFENDLELLVFLADTLKHIEKPQINPYLDGRRTLMLMQSPTHAFLLKPLSNLFKGLWTGEEYTYTYIRDRFVKPAENFLEEMLLDADSIHFIVQNLIQKIPENFKPRFKDLFGMLAGPINPLFLRQIIVDGLEEDRGLRYGRSPILSADEIDSFLFSYLPLFPVRELKERLEKLLILLPFITEEKAGQMMDLLERIPLSRMENRMGACQLQDCCKALICLSEGNTSFPHDYHLLISQAAQQLGYSLPEPIIFADTNWMRHYFAFVTNPGTGRFELWRVDYTGLYGHPMSNWKEWLNGSRPDLRWGVYIKPSEYGQI